jgi:hypothetical protein
VTVTVCCPNPACATTYPLGGLLDLGFLPDAGHPRGTTEATLGMDCPACHTHVEVRWTASWRPPT